jgi:hypothetical protein
MIAMLALGISLGHRSGLYDPRRPRAGDERGDRSPGGPARALRARVAGRSADGRDRPAQSRDRQVEDSPVDAAFARGAAVEAG